MWVLITLLFSFPLINSACNITPCLNGGNFNINSCKCDCTTSFTGLFCESQITTSTCSVLPCLNGGSFNVNTCKCACSVAFTGLLLLN
jgi:hypothetical protein